MKKLFLIFASLVFVLACGTTTPEYDNTTNSEDNSTNDAAQTQVPPIQASNTCYSEYNLTDEECKNVGTHNYNGSGWVAAPCVLDDQQNTSYQETVSVTVTFSKDNSVTIARPPKYHYNTYEFTYSEESQNIYVYYHSGVGDGPNIKYIVVFQWWGFYEEAIPDNGECKFHAEYRLTQ